jgi:ComF family protein
VFEDPIQSALHRLKYRNDIALGEALSRPLISWINTFQWNIDLVAPVPLSKERLRQRGYNQTSYIARPIALGLKILYQPQSISRIKDTPTQVGLSKGERKANVSDAFSANTRLVGGKSVLVIDDVATTGATVDACAQALFMAGACAVYCVTAARAARF